MKERQKIAKQKENIYIYMQYFVNSNPKKMEDWTRMYRKIWKVGGGGGGRYRNEPCKVVQCSEISIRPGTLYIIQQVKEKKI